MRLPCWLHLLLNVNREREGKCRAPANLRLDPDSASVHLNDALRYSEPQAGAAFLASNGIVGLLELLKQVGLIGGGDAGTGVTDRHMECAFICFGLDGDFAGVGELDGIADEIYEDLSQATAVAVARR